VIKRVTRHVFISHSSRDKQAADAVCAALEAQLFQCWIAPRNITPGADWDRRSSTRWSAPASSC
jgi:hypothetical protein